MRVLVLLACLLLAAPASAKETVRIKLPQSKTADLDSHRRSQRAGMNRFVLNVLDGKVIFKGMEFEGLGGSSVASERALTSLVEVLSRFVKDRPAEPHAFVTVMLYAGADQPWQIVRKVVRSVVPRVMRRVAKNTHPVRRFQLAYAGEGQDRLIEFVEQAVDGDAPDDAPAIPEPSGATVGQIAKAIDALRETGATNFSLAGKRFAFAPRQKGVFGYGPFAYCQKVDENHLPRLFVSVPEGITRPPLVVQLYGRDDVTRSAWMATKLLDAGFAYASVFVRDHRSRFPASIHDAKAGVRWLRAHADKYGYDASRIGVIGVRFAGYISALLGTSAGNPNLEGVLGIHANESSRVQAVLAIRAPLTFEGRFAKILGGTSDHQAKHAKQAAPRTHVSADDAAFLIVDSDVATFGTLAGGRALAARLSEAGVAAAIHVASGSTKLSDLEAESHWRVLLAFLKKSLKAQAPAAGK